MAKPLKNTKIRLVKMPPMDMQSGEWLGQGDVAPGATKEASAGGKEDMGDMLTQGDLRGRTIVMTPKMLYKIWTKALGQSDFLKDKIAMARTRGVLKGKDDKLLRFKFNDEADFDDIVDPDTNKSILPSEVKAGGTEEGYASGGSVNPKKASDVSQAKAQLAVGMATAPTMPAPLAASLPSISAPGGKDAFLQRRGAQDAKAGMIANRTPAVPSQATPKTPSALPQAPALPQAAPTMLPDKKFSVTRSGPFGGAMKGGNITEGTSNDSPAESVLKKQPVELPKGETPGMEGHAMKGGKHGKRVKMRKMDRAGNLPKNMNKKPFFFGGPVEGNANGTFGSGDPDTEKFDFYKRRGEVMGDKADNFPENPHPDDKASFAEGGAVGNRKMTGAQILKEFGVEQPGDVATVYSVEVKDGKLVKATPDAQESKRFSRIVSENAPKNTAIGDAEEQMQAAGQFNERPNVGVASGAGFQDGGEVIPPEVPSPDVGTETPPVEPTPVEAPKAEEAMKGPFESYAKVAGIDQQLVTRGDTLFTQIENALSSESPEESQAALDQLRQFVKDVENARTDAVSKANDSSLASAYKEMANDARDLLTAFENMAAESKSPEAMAAQSMG